MNSKMRHTAFILVGEELEKIAPALKQYILMYSAGEASDYLQILSYVSADDKYRFATYSLSAPTKETVFSSGLENQFHIEKTHQETVEKNAAIQQYIIDLFNRTVTIENPGETGVLNLCLCVPLFEKRFWEQSQTFIKEVINSGKQYNIDVLGLPASLSNLIYTDPDKKKQLPELQTDFKATTRTIAKEIIADERVHRLIIFEDNNSLGLALNLDTDGMLRIFGEYALLAVEHYPCLYPQSQYKNDVDVTAFGISMLAFDKIYFINYLLHKAYLDILGKENVSQKEVNINQASDWAAKQLHKHINLYSDYLKDKVEPLINERHKTGDLSDEDIQRLDTELQDKLFAAVKDMQSFIKDESKSLPEKQAILAMLLGEDDPLLEGIQYQKGQLTIDDCDKETLELYINEDNKQVHIIPATDSTPKRIERGVLSAPLDSSEHVYLPLDEMKLLRAQIRQRTTYIRKKTEELGTIENQIDEAVEIQKKISDEGFTFDGTTYKLLPSDKEARLFEKTYEPKGCSERNIDLRASFTPIKSQGAIGACSAFAMVSIFEQIMCKANPSNPDLSERFVYYNALRFANPNAIEVEDEGSSFYDVIEAMAQKGICTEELCQYEEGLSAPTTEAYDEGLSRLVKEAKNVEITHESLTSALAEGYPVAISLKIFDSFDNGKNGFIFRPSEAEIASNESGNHAMVICGFSEEDKIYIVRNSWGTKFGDKGYCYIPFSYIEDTNLNNQACIITDIEVAEEVKVAGIEKKKAVSFNLTDDTIRASILHILIDEEAILLKRDSSAYASLRYSYENLLQILANPSKRDLIYENSVKRIKQEITEAKEKYTNYVNTERPQKINGYKSSSLKNLILLSIGALLFAVISGVLFYNEWYKTTVAFSIICVILVFCDFAYYLVRQHNISILNKETQEASANFNLRIKQLEQELNEKHLRMHLAGRVISSLTDIKLKMIQAYQSLTGYVAGLDQWCQEEHQKLNNMTPPSKTPCIQMLKNDVLDKYFKEHKEEITGNIHLYDLVENFHLSDEEILDFKIGLRNRIIDQLNKICNDFSMVQYLLNKRSYDFLPQSSAISSLMPIIESRSDSFLHIKQTEATMNASLATNVFIHTEGQAERNEWRSSSQKHFTQTPGDEELDSPFKLIEIQIQNLKKEQVAILN